MDCLIHFTSYSCHRHELQEGYGYDRRNRI
nr:MAG TPA: Protein mago nashi-like protein [Caudoviricetes sp.]